MLFGSLFDGRKKPLGLPLEAARIFEPIERILEKAVRLIESAGGIDIYETTPIDDQTWSLLLFWRYPHGSQMEKRNMAVAISGFPMRPPQVREAEGNVEFKQASGHRQQVEAPVAQVMTEQDTQQPTTEALTQSLLDISIESWRFGKRFDRLLAKIDAGEQDRYRNQFRYFQKKIDESLESAQLRVVNIEGDLYDPGMAATPLNMNEFEPQDVLVVDQMLEPILMGPGGIVKTGTVTLRKVQS